ncbi:carbohydrate ABC transporter permease [Paenibacillus sp. IB182496]|uniref:Carbohydrate ABC transporter permease n=1 Tax=Paenibacillus sabuli TaxID=2772509 RepID=A0A927BYF7_9BACL|nr:carbohydrate ABC transporter permease [Paenibacillus sabuli]MBD2848045.1 carbohydrate ABC transporter permease [Paenibacillus sabuli]
MTYRSTAYRIFTYCNNTFIVLLALLCLLPLIHVLAVSFSGRAAADANLVTFWPIDFTLEGYRMTLGNGSFVGSILISIQRVVLGTGVSMALILLSAYALSKESAQFRGRNAWAWFFVFTMLFNGGLVPTYILVRNVGLMDSIWALVLPNAVNVFNMILMLNFFRTSVPKSLEEAAFMDGAGHFRTLLSIYLPISLPSLATISLFTIVFHWNSWFDGLIYLMDKERYPLSTLLQTIVVQLDFSAITSAEDLMALSNRTVKSAQIFIATIPIVLVYPFLQRYFVKGIVVGSVKE